MRQQGAAWLLGSTQQRVLPWKGRTPLARYDSDGASCAWLVLSGLSCLVQIETTFVGVPPVDGVMPKETS